MSKYKEITTQIKDRDFIVQALNDLGVPCQVAETGQSLGLVDWRGRERPERAQVVVRRQHLSRYSNDLGWAWDPEAGAFTEIISEFDRENEIARQVRQKAAYYQLEQMATSRGYTLSVIEDHGTQRVFLGGGR